MIRVFDRDFGWTGVDRSSPCRTWSNGARTWTMERRTNGVDNTSRRTWDKEKYASLAQERESKVRAPLTSVCWRESGPKRSDVLTCDGSCRFVALHVRFAAGT